MFTVEKLFLPLSSSFFVFNDRVIKWLNLFVLNFIDDINSNTTWQKFEQNFSPNKFQFPKAQKKIRALQSFAIFFLLRPIGRSMRLKKSKLIERNLDRKKSVINPLLCVHSMCLIFGMSWKFSSQRVKTILCPAVHSSNTLTIFSFSISLFLFLSSSIDLMIVYRKNCFHLEFSKWKIQTIWVENVVVVAVAVAAAVFQLYRSPE